MRRWTAVPALSAVLVVLGCGGGIGNELTGGSVPTGGRTVTGVAVLPNSIPAANATVQVRSLPDETLLNQTITNSQGQFSISGVPTSVDIDVTVMLPPSNLLEVIVPQSTLASSAGPTVNIGTVSAITSIVAAAIKLEQMNAPQDATGIVADQTMDLTNQVQRQHFSQDAENQLIGNRSHMNSQAQSLMAPVANSELAAMNQSVTQDTASAALDGILGYVRGAHSRDFQLPPSERQALINAEVAGTVYSANAVAAALQEAGVQHATAQQVLTASAKERTVLTALSASGSSISPFEAFVIAADDNTNGGYECGQNTLYAFLTNLLGY